MMQNLSLIHILFTTWDYERLLRLHAVDILQPDILLAGGFTGMLKIAAMAEPSFRNLSPHNPLSSLANCINVHFCMSVYNTTFLENEPREEGMDKDLFTSVLKVKDGFIIPNEEPGWGMDLDYECLEKLDSIVWSRAVSYTHLQVSSPSGRIPAFSKSSRL